MLKCPYNTVGTLAQTANKKMKDRKPVEWGTKYMLTVNHSQLTALLMITGEIVLRDDIEASKMAVEIGKSGNLHSHIYCVFKRSVRKDTLLNKYKQYGVQVDKITAGTEKTVIEYIGGREKAAAKGSVVIDDYTATKGDLQVTQGQRNDIGETEKALWQIKDAIDTGASTWQVWQEFFPYMVRYGRGVADYIEAKSVQEEYKLTVKDGRDIEHIAAAKEQAELDRIEIEKELLAAENILLHKIYRNTN